jgi:O-antigen/teichoic acid export membrane protein
MSRTRRFVGGVVLGYAQQILVTLTGLWLTPFLLRMIGQQDYGLWLVGLQVLAWLTLLDFGIVALLPRETAYAFGRRESQESGADIPAVIAQTWRIVLLQWPVIALASAGIWFFVPPAAPAIRGPIALIVATFALTFPLRVYRAVLEGIQDLVFLGRLQIVSWALGTVLTVILVLAQFRLYALASGWVFAQVLVPVVSFLRLRFKFPEVLPSKSTPRVPSSKLSALMGKGVWVSVSQIAQVLVDGTDFVVIGKMLGTATVVPYSCTDKLISVLSNQPAMLMHAASPGLSALKSSGDSLRAFQVAVNLTQGMLILSGAIVCVVIAVNQGFVRWWVGVNQFAGIWVTLFLAIAMVLRHSNTATVYSLFCFGYERRLSLTNLLDGLVSVVASVTLVHFWGMAGAPLGSIIGVCAVSLPANLLALSKESGTSVRTVLRQHWPWFWRFGFLASFLAVVANVWTPVGVVAIALTTVAVGAAYLAIMLPTIMRSPLAVYLPNRVVDGWNKLTDGSVRLAYNASKD